MVEEKGDFDQIGITELERQQQFFMNYFSALQEKYGYKWNDRTNAFMYAAGFAGAVDFLRLRLIPYGLARSSFTKAIFLESLDIRPNNLILQEEVKGVGGRDATRRIFERLTEAFVPVEAVAQPIQL